MAAIDQKNLEFLRFAFYKPCAADVVRALETKQDDVLQLMLDAGHSGAVSVTDELLAVVEKAVAAGRADSLRLVRQLATAGLEDTILAAALDNDQLEVAKITTHSPDSIASFKSSTVDVVRPKTDAALTRAIVAGRMEIAAVVLATYMVRSPVSLSVRPYIETAHLDALLKHDRLDALEPWIKSDNYSVRSRCGRVPVSTRVIALLQKEGLTDFRGIASSAAGCGNTGTLESLFALGACSANAGCVNTSFLYEAARSGHVAAMECLLKNGADPSTGSSENLYPGSKVKSPLYVAAENGKVGAVKVLLAAGADPNVGLVEKRDLLPTHHSPLGVAVKNGHTEVVQVLLENSDVSWLKRRKYASRNEADLTMHKALETRRKAAVKSGSGAGEPAQL